MVGGREHAHEGICHFADKGSDLILIIVSENKNNVSEIIRSISWSESCVIMGKCADYILKDFPNVIRMFVDAPEEDCVQDVIRKMNVTERRARQLVKNTSTYRSQYYHYYTGGRKWRDMENWDMILNTGRVGRDDAVQLLEQYIRIRMGRT